MKLVVRVALDLGFAPFFDYAPGDLELEPGDWVWVPWGLSERPGVVLAARCASVWPEERVRTVSGRINGAPRIDPYLRRFFERAADYYHATPGELILPAIPRALRERKPRRPDPVAAAWRTWERRKAAMARTDPMALGSNRSKQREVAFSLHAEQRAALEHLRNAAGRFGVVLLHGITGSGKTAVYLAFVGELLAQNPKAQILLLVPEIGLTPQLAALIASSLPQVRVAVMHSGLHDNERAAVWLAAARGELQLLVGTRSAISMLLPELRAIIVDEEHDASYKQLEGVHYQARDLAVLRAQLSAIPVVLASATPSMESWRAALAGRYTLVRMPQRANRLPPPAIEIVDMRGMPQPAAGLAPQSLEVIEQVLQAGGQSLVFLNRRGFSPVLHCGACGWTSQCTACSAYRVLHRRRSGFSLICHHCGLRAAVPRHCPQCGNIDLCPQGRGTQKLVEELAVRFPEARIARIDRDSASANQLTKLLQHIHRGEVDLVVGTQMLAKGHDWAHLRAVVVLEADSGLFATDYRAVERLFANLMQVAGRAGRGGGALDGEGRFDGGGAPGGEGPTSDTSLLAPRVLIQTLHPGHPLFADLRHQDFEAHAGKLLAERERIGLPPFRHHALLRAQSRQLVAVEQFMVHAKSIFEGWVGTQGRADLRCYDPVPMPMARIDHWHRMQLLLDAGNRPLLHRALEAFRKCLAQAASPGFSAVRWQIDVDPQEI
jgi:primosomal protein N' (replication factor Y)